MAPDWRVVQDAARVRQQVAPWTTRFDCWPRYFVHYWPVHVQCYRSCLKYVAVDSTCSYWAHSLGLLCTSPASAAQYREKRLSAITFLTPLTGSAFPKMFVDLANGNRFLRYGLIGNKRSMFSSCAHTQRLHIVRKLCVFVRFFLGLCPHAMGNAICLAILSCVLFVAEQRSPSGGSALWLRINFDCARMVVINGFVVAVFVVVVS